MNFFKDTESNVYFLSQDDVERGGLSLLPSDCEEISEAEAKALQQPTAEQLTQQARAQRDALLTGSDWVVAKAYEAGEQVPAEWAKYRQSLRDISSQDGFPAAIDWPVAPT